MKGELVGKVERIHSLMMEYGAEMIQAMIIMIFGLLMLQFVLRKLRALMDKKAKYRTMATTLLGIFYILALILIFAGALIAVGFDSRYLLRIIIMIGLAAIVVLLVLRPYLPTLPFRAGKTVKVGSFLGKIEATTMIHTRMRTFDGKTVFIPNSIILKDVVINYHHTPTRRLKIDIPIRHIKDILKAKQVMESIMIDDPRVRLEPARPTVYVLNLVDGCVKLGARCWVDNDKYWISQCEMLEKMLYRIDLEKIILAGRRHTIRVFHETPLLISDQEKDVNSDMNPASDAQGIEERGFAAVSNEDEM